MFHPPITITLISTEKIRKILKKIFGSRGLGRTTSSRVKVWRTPDIRRGYMVLSKGFEPSVWWRGLSSLRLPVTPRQHVEIAGGVEPPIAGLQPAAFASWLRYHVYIYIICMRGPFSLSPQQGEFLWGMREGRRDGCGRWSRTNLSRVRTGRTADVLCRNMVRDTGIEPA